MADYQVVPSQLPQFGAPLDFSDPLAGHAPVRVPAHSGYVAGTGPQQQVLRNPAAMIRFLAAQGQGHDNMIAHINPAEAQLLHAVEGGTSGSINPHTGIVQFDPGVGGGGGGGYGDSHDIGEHGGSGGGVGGGGGGNSGNGGGIGSAGFGGGVSRGSSFAGSDLAGHANPDPAMGSSHSGGGGVMGGASGGYNSLSALAQKDPLTSEALANQRDYANVGNDFADRVGNFIAHQFGFNEIDPTKMNQKALASGTFDPQGHITGGTLPGANAHWGFDPAGLIGSAVGMAAGVPMLGTAADALSSAFGRPLESDLGASVFGSPDLPSTGTGGSLLGNDLGLSGLGNGLGLAGIGRALRGAFSHGSTAGGYGAATGRSYGGAGGYGQGGGDQTPQGKMDTPAKATALAQALASGQ